MKHYNYNSDFKIVEQLKADAPFRYTYYTKKDGKSVVAEYDGTEYNNCIARDGELVIPIDGKALGIGEVKVKREYFLNDADFADGICNLVTDKVPTGIELGHGESDAAEEVRVEVAPYYHTIVVGGGGDADLRNYYTKTEVDAKIPTKTSQLTNDSDYVSNDMLNGKQDKIADLDTIREGAAKGATALQAVPSNYATKDDVQAAINESIIQVINSDL